MHGPQQGGQKEQVLLGKDKRSFMVLIYRERRVLERSMVSCVTG